MAKIGILVLNGGVWNGAQVVSKSWIGLSMQRAARADAAEDYGFMWWLPVLPAPAAKSGGPVYMAGGWGASSLPRG
jgi:CubicO group peptidase (beta-lactamase class C family)